MWEWWKANSLLGALRVRSVVLFQSLDSWQFPVLNTRTWYPAPSSHYHHLEPISICMPWSSSTDRNSKRYMRLLKNTPHVAKVMMNPSYTEPSHMRSPPCHHNSRQSCCTVCPRCLTRGRWQNHHQTWTQRHRWNYRTIHKQNNPPMTKPRQTDNKGEGGKVWQASHGSSMLAFFGRKTHRQCEQSISTLIHTKEPPVVGLPRWQSWQCILLTEIESLALLLAGCL